MKICAAQISVTSSSETKKAVKLELKMCVEIEYFSHITLVIYIEML